MAKRIVTKIGDVFCVEVDNAYKRYFQYFCNDMSELNSSVIRVFKKRYPMDSNPKPEAIVSDEVDFYAHTILRDGIEDGIWYKIGKVRGNYDKEMEVPIFGTCQSSIYNNGNIIFVDPNTNWYIWKINQKPVKVGILQEQYKNIVERGGVFPCVEIADRIKLGYYRWNSSAYNSLRRQPYPDTNSFIKRNIEDAVEYIHFTGENVVQRLVISSGDMVVLEEGHSLNLPKFWETNWDIDEFITAEEFKAAWDRYALKQ